VGPGGLSMIRTPFMKEMVIWWCGFTKDARQTRDFAFSQKTRE
jgi:hypothetical protein